jgi:hypothetical protein
VVEIDGRLVGSAGWSVGGGFQPSVGTRDVAPAGGQVAEGTAVLRAAYVDLEYARCGLVTMLVRTSEIAAGLAGLRRCEAICTPPSEGMLRKLGYRLVERTAVPITGEVSWQGARMRKNLAAAPPAATSVGTAAR